jgi:hypothetical protein
LLAEGAAAGTARRHAAPPVISKALQNATPYDGGRKPRGLLYTEPCGRESPPHTQAFVLGRHMVAVSFSSLVLLFLCFYYFFSVFLHFLKSEQIRNVNKI